MKGPHTAAPHDGSKLLRAATVCRASCSSQRDETQTQLGHVQGDWPLCKSRNFSTRPVPPTLGSAPAQASSGSSGCCVLMTTSGLILASGLCFIILGLLPVLLPEFLVSLVFVQAGFLAGQFLPEVMDVSNVRFDCFCTCFQRLLLPLQLRMGLIPGGFS